MIFWKVKKVDGSTLYDALELSFNTVDKTSILKVNDINIVSSLNFKDLTSNVYSNQEIDNKDIIYANSLNTKAAINNVYNKTEFDLKFY